MIHRHAQIGSIHRRRSAANQLPFIEVNPAVKQDRSQKPDRPDGSDPLPADQSSSLIQSTLACRCFTSSNNPCPVHTIHRMPTNEHHVIDPFASTVVNVDREAHALLQYFIHVSHPRTWDSEAQSLPDRSYTFQSDALTLVQGSLQNEMHFYTLLASMASQLHHFEHAEQYQESTEPLIQKAIAAMRKYIETSPQIDQRLVFDIHQMAVTEFYRYDLSASLVHLTAVSNLVSHLGGLDQIDPSLKEWIVIGDNYLAAELLQKPIFPATSFDPGEGDLQLHEDCGVGGPSSLAGVRFQETKYQEIFPMQMREILRGMAECTALMAARSNTNTSLPKTTFHWLVLRVTALRQRLLDLEGEDGRTNAIRITLIIWLFLVTTVTGRHRTSKVLAAKLKALLVQLGQEVWSGYEDVFLWLLLVGAMSSEDEVRRWFIQVIRLRQSHGVYVHEDEVARFSSGFFYLETVQRPMLEAIVNEMRVLPTSTSPVATVRTNLAGTDGV